MGGSGSYYDRDVTATYRTLNNKGYSDDAERVLGRNKMDPELLPKGWRLYCVAKNPLVNWFDVTGSMGILPKIIWDKWPGIVGQLAARHYLPDPEMSVAAIGDIRHDHSPLQVCNFDKLRNLDRWLKRLHFEGGGGGQGSESYEMMAYYYLHYCEMPNAELPIIIMTGVEACVDTLYASDLKEQFGGDHEDISTKEVFRALLEKFHGNVFRIQRYYPSHGSEGWDHDKIVAQWERLIGRERVIHLPEDRAIGDIMLGIYAIASGATTLTQYLIDMRERPLNLAEGVKFEPQSLERVKQVEKALAQLRDYKPLRPSRRTGLPRHNDTESTREAWTT